MTESYSEVDRQRAWIKRGKGKGLRWLILRDIVAVLSKQALTTTQLADVMLLRRGLSHNRSNQMLQELESSMAIVQEHDKQLGYYWTARKLGVDVFLGSRMAIPAQVAQELFFWGNARESEDPSEA